MKQLTITKRIFANVLATILACLLACSFGVMKNVYASEDISDMKQTIYNQDNGLGTSEINCIYQTNSGYVWVGTDSGLYRYNGSEFRLYNLWNTDKEDVYYINSLFQDSKGRLWVATNNYGLFYIDNAGVQHFSDDYYNGVKTVNDVCESYDGNIYVATAYGVYTVNGEGTGLIRVEGLEKHSIQGIECSKDSIWGIYNGNTIFSIDKNGAISEQASSDYTSDELSTISTDEFGRIFIGTIGNDVLSLSGMNSIQVMNSSLNGINKILINDGQVLLCTDGGVGYFKNDGSFVAEKGLSIDNYITDVMIDYEGNYWFASKRTGILYLSKGKFTNLSRAYSIPDSIANAVYIHDGYTYIGTDDGLMILDGNNKIVTNDLTDHLLGTSISDICADNFGTLWVATYRRYGVIRYTKSGNLKSINRANGLVSNLINGIYKLSDGNLAIYTEEGITILEHSGEIVDSYNYESGLDYTNVNCMYESKDGHIYIGTNGGGLYELSDGKIRRAFNEDDGLTSNNVNCITEGESGLWIGTTNGLSFYNETIRAISNIDYSNNIISLLNKDDTLYIVGSKGLISATEKELLGTAPLKNRYFSTGDGIENQLTLNSKNYFKDNKKLYLCTTGGVVTFDTENIFVNDNAPKITVSEVNVDGNIEYFNQTGGAITIPSDAQRLEINFAVLSFYNRENIEVTYQLVGFDNEPQMLSGSDNLEAVYTNLDGGTYILNVKASNGDGIDSEEALSFTIVKELGFFEKRVVRIVIVALIVVITLLLIVTAYKFQQNFASKKRELEDLAKEHEDTIKNSSAKTDYLANMSNEIKIPLNAMISTANTMLKDSSTDESTQAELRSIIDKGHDVLGKVDETILLARLESGSEEVLEEPYSITTLICDISDNMLNKLSEQPIKFLVDLGDNIPDIMVGDFDKIKSVLEIVLDNAIKYTKEGSITLSVDCYDFKKNKEDERSNLVFSIADTGTGISEDRLEHIFELYYEDESKKSIVNTGNGISLTIAKKLSEIMEGELEVESTYGAGSTFTFSVFQKKLDTDGSSIPLNENTIDRVSREEAERMWAPDLHVLLVDDVDISRNVAKSVLTSMEIKCDTASSGLSAIDMVMNNEYDLVLMDIAMPVMNGIDALKEIRDLSDESFKTLPVIAMSEDVIGKNRQEIISEGFSDVILKPFDITVLAGLLIRFASPDKIKYKTNDVAQYITESRYSDGLKKLEDFFDVVGVLDKIGGSIEVYNRILISFHNQNKDSIEELSTMIDTDFRALRSKIHNIRNGCQNIGAIEASEIALRLENAINLGNKSYVKDNINLLYDALTVINEYIDDYTSFISEHKGLSDEEYAAKHKTTIVKKPADDYDPNFDSAFIVEAPAKISENDDDNADARYDDVEISDDSDIKTTSKSDANEVPIINIDKLRIMREATYVQDITTIKSVYNKICGQLYGADDMEFLAVLNESIENGDMVQINELLDTYINLKSSL